MGARGPGVSEFLHMGGYAFYVWTAYGAALVVLALNLVAPMARRRRLIRKQDGTSSNVSRAEPTPPPQ